MPFASKLEACMKPKTMILMFVAIGCGLAASYMTSRVIAERNSEQTEVEKVSVLVAKKNMNLGTHIKNPETLFEEKYFVKGEEPKKAIRTFDLLKDKRLNKPISSEQFVTEEDLVDKLNDGLAAVVQPGMRAIGLKVNVESSGGGFVLPHSRVDLVHVVRNEKETTSRIIMQNVLVLAVDQAAVKPEDKNSFVPQTVTVEVTPAQAEELALAQDIGSLRLILRAFADDERIHTPGVSPKSIGSTRDGKVEDTDESPSKETAPKLASKIPDVPDASAALEVKAPQVRSHTLTISNGESVTKHVFSLNANNEVVPSGDATQDDQESAPAPTPKPTEAPKVEAPKVSKGYKPVPAPVAVSAPKPSKQTTSSPAATGFQEAPLPGMPAPKN
jgi:pilus assembly protein CpaB